MIDIKELRIGNYLETYAYDTNIMTNQITYVGGIRYGVVVNGIRYIDDGNYNIQALVGGSKAEIWTGNVSPIRLTTDILLNNEFKETKNSIGLTSYIHQDSQLELVIIQDSSDEKICHNYQSDKYRPLSYVHQLQNLYFDCTGKELNLNI